jgi:uncharacterized protein YbbC (DUF1343 family)
MPLTLGFAATFIYCAGRAPDAPNATRVDATTTAATTVATTPTATSTTTATATSTPTSPATSPDPFIDPAPMPPALAAIEPAVEKSISDGKIPGAVVVIGTRDSIVYRRAFGSRALEPSRVPMTLDTVFDLASLTKAVATTSIMVLVDRGAITLDEPASRYVPELATKSPFTVRQLLLHTAGFVPDDPLSDYDHGPDEAWKRLLAAPLRWTPGERFVYSDVGFMMLGEIVRRVSGKDVAAFASENVFAPLGMTETTFVPPPDLRARAAPTEHRDGGLIQGEVHDPRAFGLGGIAGHAGLFSTGRDLSLFARTLLGRGTIAGASSKPRLFSADTFNAFTSPHDIPTGVRALGWDMMTPGTKNRGDGMSFRAFGHGGYTGTSLWIDPEGGYFVLVLTNRVHLGNKGAAHELQSKIGTLAVAAFGRAPAAPILPALVADVDGGAPCEPAGRALAGIDVLAQSSFAPLRGKKIALLTNGSARTKDGARTLDALAHATGVTLVRVLSPEHGISADREGAIEDGTDTQTSLPIVSLYGANFDPPPESLADIDALVIDLPDVGARFYTYASTMRRAMRAASAAHVGVVILDRPNPIDGVDVAGPLSDAPLAGATTRSLMVPGLPVRHGMTMGELARMFDADEHWGTDLRIVEASGWRRSDYLDTAGLSWSAPSPNLRSLNQAVLYPGVALVEGTNVSVGRGTDTPFEIVGAPYVAGDALAAAMERTGLPGVRFQATSFTPKSTVFANEKCSGVKITITDRARFEPVKMGVALAMTLRTLYPTTFHSNDVNRLLANKNAMNAIAADKTLAEVLATWDKDLAAFRTKREKYLVYRSSRACP